MLRLDHCRRAPFFEDDAYTLSTRETYAGRYGRFVRAAQQAEHVPLEAPTDWIKQFFLDVALCSPTEARKLIPAVAHFFRINGKADAFPYDELTDLLRETSAYARDPLGAPMASIALRQRERRRARAFCGRLTPSVRAAYARDAQAWEIFARRYTIDPLHPTITQFLGCLAVYARSHVYRSVSNFCCALSHYFRGAKVPDLTRHEKTRAFLITVARESARTSTYIPLYEEHLRAMVLSFSDAPLDVRDRCICLLTHYGALFGTAIGDLERDVTFYDDGVELLLRGKRRFVGGVDDEQLDVRIWLRRWIALLPADPGPLFVAVGPRGVWLVTPLTDAHVCRIVRAAAARANIYVPYPTLALRKGFAIRAERAVGPVLTASYLGLKHTSSLEHLTSIDRRSSLVERLNARASNVVRSSDASAI